MMAPSRSRPRQSRSRGLRVRTGCLTCRKRHLKCDESRPYCGLCARSNKTCTYPEPSVQENRAAATNAGSVPSPSADDTSASTSHAEASFEIQSRPPRNDFLGHDRRTTENQSLSSWNTSLGHDRHISQNQASSAIAEESYRPLSSDNHGVPAMSSYQAQQGSMPPRPAEKDDSISVTLQSQSFPPPEYFGPSPATMTELSYGSVIDVAAARWFGMLANDAEIGPASPRAANAFALQFPESTSYPDGSASWGTPANRPMSSSLDDSMISPDRYLQASSQEAADSTFWKSPKALMLKSHEQRYLGVFVNRISCWIDLFDPYRHFCALVPRLAMFNVGLLNAVLALSIRYVALNPSLDISTEHEQHDALRYYHESLHYVQNAMQCSSYLTSLELLATALIISTYEMLDGSRRDWERHLQGVFGIQRSQVIHGDTGGLRAAVWWAWLQQDVWAAFREKREVFTFWRPVKTFGDLTTWELASRSVFLMAKVVNYCAQVEGCGEDNNIQSRMDGADRLSMLLEDWERHLSIEFTPLPLEDFSDSTVFKPCWIQPPALGVAIEVYNAAQILLTLHRPSLGGLNGFMKRQKLLDKCAEAVGGIAVTLTDYGSSVASSQCLFIAGMVTSDERKRVEILRLIGLCRLKSGWPVKPIDDDLRAIWHSSDAT